MVFGVLFGLSGALLISGSYVLSRRYLNTPNRSIYQLLSLSHAQMSLMSLMILPFVIFEPKSGWLSILFPLAAAAGSYFFGQAMLFASLRSVPASRVTPFLGLKVMFVAILFITIFGKELNQLQWISVCLSVIAALCLLKTGDKIPWISLLLIILSCFGLSCAEIAYTELIIRLGGESRVQTTILAGCLVYCVCSLCSVVLYKDLIKSSVKDWVDSYAYTMSYYLSAFLFLAAISTVGVLFMTILQSSRCVIAIGLGALLAWKGWVDLEKRVEWQERVRQLAAASLMMLSIGLYCYAA